MTIAGSNPLFAILIVSNAGVVVGMWLYMPTQLMDSLDCQVNTHYEPVDSSDQVSIRYVSS